MFFGVNFVAIRIDKWAPAISAVQGIGEKRVDI